MTAAPPRRARRAGAVAARWASMAAQAASISWSTPLPLTPEMRMTLLSLPCAGPAALTARASARALRSMVVGIQGVDLVEADELRLGGELRAIGLELGADGAVGLAQLLLRAVDQMDQHAAALDMAEEAVAEAGALMGALDQPGDVGQHEFAIASAHDAELRGEGGEGIVGDLRLGPADGGQQGRFAGIGQADQPGIGDQLQPQPDPALLAGPAGAVLARRPVGRGLEMGIAEAAVAAARTARCAGPAWSGRRAGSRGPRRGSGCRPAP